MNRFHSSGSARAVGPLSVAPFGWGSYPVPLLTRRTLSLQSQAILGSRQTAPRSIPVTAQTSRPRRPA